MVVRKMTDEELEQIFGLGQVVFGQRKPQSAATPSESHNDPEISDAVDEQDEHDKRMLAMSESKRKAMVKGLGDLARDKASETGPPDLRKKSREKMKITLKALDKRLANGINLANRDTP
jgi:hypothetical protein